MLASTLTGARVLFEITVTLSPNITQFIETRELTCIIGQHLRSLMAFFSSIFPAVQTNDLADPASTVHLTLFRMTVVQLICILTSIWWSGKKIRFTKKSH
jgi:cytochrome bd-type quinol oxidase subunit 2